MRSKRNKIDKFLIVDSDSAIYACCFITVRTEHFACLNGKMVFGSRNKNKYNAWFKEQTPIDQTCIEYSKAVKQLPFSEAKKAFDGWLVELQKLAGNDRFVLLLTKGGSCFRTYRAVLRKYKGNRDNLVKPPYYDELRAHLIKKHKALVYKKWEADDTACMSMETAATKPDTVAILAAIDKDLDQQAGKHINPNKKKEGVFVVSKLEGLRSFYRQMLMGDVADNIPGLKGVGKKHKSVLALEDCGTEMELFALVFKAYQKNIGDFHTFTPWWWDETKLSPKDDEGNQRAKYFDPDYFDIELAEERRALLPDKELTYSIEDVFYENADLLYMLRHQKDQYHTPVKAGNKLGFKVREDFPTGIVDAMLGED